jgi:17beta-estradiol 17-dehydrogenase / very-long-chain 3-oxoacyl-CoA reductase
MSIQDFVGSITDNKIGQVLIYSSLLVGVYKLTIFTLSIGSLIFDLFLIPATNFKKYGSKSGNWAVVTGASDGIGKEYALQLAGKGFNIVLVSRTKSKLELLSTEIETKYKVATRIVAFDASSDSNDDYQLLKQTIESLPVTILINNVGQSHSIPVPFLETTTKELQDIITINNVATLKITQIVTTYIISTIKTKKCRGLILNMGSFGGLLPTPYLAVYSGSKAFLQSWSAALAGELKSQHIDVELIISYLVTSAMSKIKRSSLFIPNPKNFVKSVLAGLGKRNGAQERFATNTPFWTHAFMHFGIENSVGVYSAIANKLNLSMHKSIRIRALKKQAREKKE